MSETTGSGGERRRHGATSRRRMVAQLPAGYSLLKLLIASFWFRLVVALSVFTVLALALAVPRMWRTTPPDFRPEIKVRLVSFAKVWSLKRTARAREAEGQNAQALAAWRTAWGNNRGDEEALRGMLRVLGTAQATTQNASLALQGGQWLLRLGATNDSDLVAIASAWLNQEMGGYVWELLGKRPAPLSSQALERLYLVALVQAGQGAEFGRRFATNSLVSRQPFEEPASAGAAPAGPVGRFDLVQAAFVAGWGSPGEREAALSRLRSAQQQIETRSLAYRLEFLVHEHRADAAACARILDALRESGERPLILHTAYWEVLAHAGQSGEARRLATNEPLTPRDPFEAYRLLRAYSSLDMWDEADRLANTGPLAPGWIVELDVTRARSLIRSRNWDELHKIAERLRGNPGASELVGGYPRYLEAMAQSARGETAAALEGFAAAAAAGIPDATLAQEVAVSMIEAGAPGPATALLKKHRDSQAGNPAFWHLLVRCADVLLDEYTLWEAMTRLKELLPDDPIVENNYAVVLTVRREQPEEIIRHTFTVFQRAPDNPTVVLNHAAALILNGRLREARDLLERVLPAKLAPRDQAQYYITRYELELREGNRSLAEQLRGNIDVTLLWPSQRTWLETSLAGAKAR